jgi:hypothetical protein
MKFFLPARSLCIVFYLAVFTSAASAQTFENAAKDNQEAPYVQSMTATTTGTDLVLRLSRILISGARAGSFKRAPEEHFTMPTRN